MIKTRFVSKIDFKYRVTTSHEHSIMEVTGRIDSLPVIGPELGLLFSRAPGVFLIFNSEKVLAVRRLSSDQVQTAEIMSPAEVFRRSENSYEVTNASPRMTIEQLVSTVTMDHPFGVLVRAEICASRDNSNMMVIWSRLEGLHPEFSKKVNATAVLTPKSN